MVSAIRNETFQTSTSTIDVQVFGNSKCNRYCEGTCNKIKVNNEIVLCVQWKIYEDCELAFHTTGYCFGIKENKTSKNMTMLFLKSS